MFIIKGFEFVILIFYIGYLLLMSLEHFIKFLPQGYPLRYIIYLNRYFYHTYLLIIIVKLFRLENK